MFLDTSSSKTEEKTAIIFEQSYYGLITILHLSYFALLHLSVTEEKLLGKILQRGDSPRALRFFGKIFEIEMLSPGGARTHDRGQLSKLFPINLNARGESPRCKVMLYLRGEKYLNSSEVHISATS